MLLSLFCGSSHMYWDLLLTCRIVERRVDVLYRGYVWFSERINAVVGCSGSLVYAFYFLVLSKRIVMYSIKLL
jgi:hypothetical protein